MSRISGNDSSFATELLQRLGAPVTDANVTFIEKWISREGGGGDNNPLNTTQQMSGSTVLAGNSAGVQNYGDLDTGLQATVKTLNNGYYGDILSALKSGDALAADREGKLQHGLSTWSGGAYGSVANTQIKPSLMSTKDANAAQGQPLSGAELTQYVEQNYPQYGYLLHDPEVGPILIQAAQKGVSDPNVLEGMLNQTQWWQHTSSTARQFDEQMSHDPASMNQALNLETNAVLTQAQQMGVQVSRQQAWQMAVNYLRLGEPPQAISQHLAAMFKYGNGQGLTGTSATLQQQIEQIYSDYAVPISGQTIGQQVQQLLSQQDATANGQTGVNNTQLQAIKDQVAAQAQSLYASNPGLVQAIKQGQTVQQWADPYKQKAAQLLGINPNSIDISAPMWSQMLKPASNQQTGEALNQSMTLDQWETKLRTDPVYGYDHSFNAIQSASQLAAGLKQTLGFGSAA